jgi:triacylglycerol esterase/lipase EstA (alpha/beta hydrolase family)
MSTTKLRFRAPACGVIVSVLALVGVLGGVAGVTVAAPAASAAAPTRPVIVVAGLDGAAYWYDTLAGRLRSDGYTTFVYQLPGLGMGDIHASAQAFAGFVDGVLGQTGADQVELVGHSEGGLVSRDYLQTLGGAAKVDKLITLGTPNQGTLSSNITQFLTLGTCLGVVACTEMSIGSAYLTSLDAGDDAVGQVRYWAFASKYDELVYPYPNAFLVSSSGRVTNLAVQDQCPGRVLGHVALVYDLTVYSGIQQALQGSTSVHLNCWTPIVGPL